MEFSALGKRLAKEDFLAEAVCTSHRNKRREYYCFGCEDAICGKCLIEKHRTCEEIEEIQDVVDVLSKKVSEEINQGFSKRKKQSEEFLKQSKEILTNEQQDTDTLIGSLEKVCVQLKEIARSIEDKEIPRLLSKKNIILQKLELVSAESKKRIDEIEYLENFMTTLSYETMNEKPYKHVNALLKFKTFCINKAKRWDDTSYEFGKDLLFSYTDLFRKSLLETYEVFKHNYSITLSNLNSHYGNSEASNIFFRDLKAISDVFYHGHNPSDVSESFVLAANYRDGMSEHEIGAPEFEDKCNYPSEEKKGNPQKQEKQEYDDEKEKEKHEEQKEQEDDSGYGISEDEEHDQTLEDENCQVPDSAEPKGDPANAPPVESNPDN